MAAYYHVASGLFDKVLAQRTGKSGNRALGARIVKQSRRAFVHRHRCAGDDRCSAVQMRHGRMGKKEHREYIGLKRPAQLQFGDVLDVFVGMLFSGVADEHIDPAEFLYHGFHQPIASFTLAQIA